MIRYEQPVEVAPRVEHLVDNGRPRDPTQLFVRIERGGIVARWPPSNGFDDPPQFTGHGESRAGGAVVVGSIRESKSSAMWARIMAFPMAIMLGCVVLGAVSLLTDGLHYGVAPLLIGVFGAPLFAALWHWFRRIRRPDFDSHARRLDSGLTRYLTTGDGNRPTP